jgi:hypothetical protein
MKVIDALFVSAREKRVWELRSFVPCVSTLPDAINAEEDAQEIIWSSS